jgi:hypothetical protein
MGKVSGTSRPTGGSPDGNQSATPTIKLNRKMRNRMSGGVWVADGVEPVPHPMADQTEM